MGRNRLKKTRTARLRLTVTSRAEGKGRVDPAALQFCHRRGAPVSPAEPVTSGTLCAPPTRGDAPSRRAPPPRRPGCSRLAETAGAESAHWKPAGTLRELEGARGEAQTGRAPPIPFWPPRRLTRGRGRGGGGSRLRLAVKSGSGSSLERERAQPGPSSSPPPPPAQLLARPQPPPPRPRAARHQRHQPQTAGSPSEKRQERQHLSHRPGSSSTPTARLQGV